jgi:membrane fusion protein (multidrug efflux system)
MKSWVRVVLSIVVLLVIVGVLGAVKGMQIGAMIDAGKTFVPPPEPVTTATVTSDEWSGAIAAVGSVVPVNSVVIASEVPGLVRALSFDSGDRVQKGQVLVRLDTSIEEAQLASAEAEARVAKSSADRVRALRKESVVAESELESAEARATQAEAQVLVLRATIDKKTVRAPFSGRLGIRQIDLGQILAPGTPIVSLSSLDPVYVEVSLPQQALARVAEGQAVRVSSDAFPDKSWEGTVALINNEVDAATRNVKVRARIPNKDGGLRPGMFVSASLGLAESATVRVIPGTSVLYAPYGDSVFVVEPKDGKLTVRQQFVRLGERRGDLVAVVDGLTVGQVVVTTGAFKLRNGGQVVVDNKLAPSAVTSPRPRTPEHVDHRAVHPPTRASRSSSTVLILIAGLQAVRSLNVRQYPKSENASIVVTTAYIGADAELVRGFITTPLERAMAAADGIEYLESREPAERCPSCGPASSWTTTPPAPLGDQLQDRPGARRSAARVRGPVHQHRVLRQPVRLGVPELFLGVPRAERDHRLPRACRAAAPLGGGGRAARRYPGRAHLRHADLARARQDGGPQREPRSRCGRPWRSTTTSGRGGQTKGSFIQVNLTANTDCAPSRSSSSWWCAIRAAPSCAWATSPRSPWAPRTTTPRCASAARPRCSSASGRCPTPTPWTS